MGQIEGPTLEALISFMYTRTVDISLGKEMVALFLAADAHQASGLTYKLSKTDCGNGHNSEIHTACLPQGRYTLSRSTA